MAVQTIPDVEVIVGAYLRDHPDVLALGARVAPRTPSSQTAPWVRLTQLDAQNEPKSRPEHLLNYLAQLDCYAGKAAMDAHRGQAEASLLARTVRAALDAMPEATLDGVVVTRVRFSGMPRIPDTDFEPARERVILTATIWMHAT